MKLYCLFFFIFIVSILSTNADDTSEEKSKEKSKEKIDETVTEKTAEEICRQPKFTGYCRAAIPFYYYNVASGECERFTYGGCGKNDNSFFKKADCEAKCKGVKPAEE